MSQILITGANPYNANKGVAALCYSLVYLVHSILKECNIKSRIAVYNHEYKKLDDQLFYGDESIAFRNIHPTEWINCSNVIKTFTNRWHFFNFLEFQKSNLVFSLNAGDSFADIYGENIFNSINRSNILSLQCKKPLVLMPQTYGPFISQSKTERKAKRIISKSNLVLTRDKESMEYIHSLIPEKEVEELIDLAFFLPYQKHTFNNNSINVGINISALLWNGGYTQNNQFSLLQSYSEIIWHLIDELLTNPMITVHLVPHVVSDTYNIENDYAVAYNIWKIKNHSRLILSPFFLSPVEAKNYISGLDMFVGSRMHACIAAYSSGVPVIPMAYSRKFSGLFTETLGYKYNVDLKVCSVDNVIKTVNIVLDDLCKIKKDIALTNNTVVNERKVRTYKLIKEQIIKYIN